MKRILVVDDEAGIRESLRATFSDRYEVAVAGSGTQALTIMQESRIDLVLLDVLMPGKDGIEVLKEIHAGYPGVPVVMVSASPSVRPVVDAIRLGASDYVKKPFDVAELRLIVSRALRSEHLQRKLEVLQAEVSDEFPVDHIIGEAPSFRRAVIDMRKAAETDSTVLVCGESGTGKEMAARSIHSWSSRSDEPFVAVHCAALPELLLESELFGYEKGAFTNADRQKPGRFDLAGSGTIFFDEVSEMSVTMQAKLLRVIESREFMRIGGTRVLHTDARIIAATAVDLKKEVDAQRFRDSLYYRLSVIPILLPPLRERREDIPLLARFFLASLKKSMRCSVKDFEPEALEIMCDYNWPGNVRELRNVVERILALNKDSETVLPSFLPEEMAVSSKPDPVAASGRPAVAPGSSDSMEDAVSEYERQLIEEALKKEGGVQVRAAKRLGTTRRKLRYRMQKFGMEPDSPEAAGD